MQNNFFSLLFCLISYQTVQSNDGNSLNNRQNEDIFPVSIIHMNDFHARFEETNEGSAPCKRNTGEKCIGGYARAVTVIKELKEARKETNPIYLNAGDNFQGTLWYNLLRWNVTSYFLNMMNADAMTIGNHEFDHGVEGLVPFLETIQSPIVVTNIDDSEEPMMQGKYRKSIVIDRYERKIGVIGVILSTTNTIAQTGKLKFKDESETVKAEAALLKSQGVDIIIVLSHCGLDVDYTIARNAGANIDIIVGGHSHTFMFTGDNPPGTDIPIDGYPAVVRNDGHTVLIVQASAYTKYIGDLTVYFDAKGEIVNWEGYPIYLDTNIEQDTQILRELQPFKEIVDKEGNRILGVSKVALSRSDCSYECNIGNLITDAAVHHYVNLAEEGKEWTRASIAITNNGGIRTSLTSGTLTYADVITAIPFENTFDLIELRGDHLLRTLEYQMVPSSGLKVVYNNTNPIGRKVISVDVLCNECLIPKYYSLDLTKMYRIIVNSYLADGGDGFEVLKTQKKGHMIGPIDIDVVTKYVERMSPIMIGIEGRVTVLS